MRSRLRALWAVTRLGFRADRRGATAASVCFVAQGVLGTVNTILLARVITAIVELDGGAAATYLVATVVVDSAVLAITMLGLDLRFRLTEKATLLIEQELISTMTSVPSLDLHERPVHLDRIEILRKQTGTLGNSIGALLHNVSLVTGLLSVVGVLVTIDPRLVLLPVAGVPLLYCSGRAMSAYQRAMDDTAESQRRADHLFVLATSPGPAKELRTFGIAGDVVERHTSFLAGAHRRLDRVSLRWGALQGATWALLGTAQVGAIALVTLAAIDGRASVADVVVTVSLAASLDHHLEQMNEMVTWLFNALRSAERYLAVLDDAPKLEATAAATGDTAPAPVRLRRGIELRGVGFRYPDTDADVLRDVDLVLPAGSTVALVGENGAGKSTLVKLLGRYYDPTTGAIAVDDVDLRRIDVREWRARASGAFQDHARFELVAGEVVGVGAVDRIDDRPAITGALARAGGAALPDQLTRGLDTPLGTSFEDGIEPSGGQWQQLALGRALLRDRPLLLVLDEPTSALDPEAEHTLFEGYAAAARTAARETGAITLLVSHRFSTVRMADLIVVLEDGTVAQSGTHDELVAAGGTYAELYAMQARAYR